MRKTAMIICAAAAVAAGFLMLTCSNPAGGDNPSSAAWTYSTCGSDTLIINHPQYIDTDCDTGTLVSDTTPAYSDTATYTLSANQDTLFVHDGSGTHLLVRQGTGTGIQGTWTMNQMGFDVTLTVGDSTITASMCLADLFMETYGRMIDSLDLAVTVNQASCSSVILTGDSTHEQVTIIYTQSGSNPDNMDADITFQSDNPQHAQTTVYADPASCPNDAPSWFSLFLFYNW